MSTGIRNYWSFWKLEKSLVYFTTSLRSNEVVLEKLLKVETHQAVSEDTDLLEDVIMK